MASIGSYDIVSKIGEGSFGRTFLATHKTLKFQVVLKQEKTAEPFNMKLFREEAEMLQKMRHFGFPSLLDYYETPDVGQVMALSYIPGITGADLKPVTDEHMCWIIDRVLSALSYLHGHWHMIHCDLKPDNIIIDVPNHMVTIIDLGMAAQNVKSNSRAKGGTPGYMPPEFETGLPPVTASDIYSVGKIAIALTGGDVLSGEPPDNMHSTLKDTIRKTILRDPRERYLSVDKLREDLHKARMAIFGRATSKVPIEYR